MAKRLPTTEARPSGRSLCFSAAPFANWPSELRRAWSGSLPPEWSPSQEALYRRAYGLFRAYCQHVRQHTDHSREAISAYGLYLYENAPRRAGQKLFRLHVALTVLFPKKDWSWLAQETRERRAQFRPPRRPRIPGPRSGDSLSLSFPDWPEEDCEKWHRGLAAPNPACSRLEHYTERRRHLARDRSGTDAGASDRRLWAKAPYQWSAATVRSARYAYGSFIKAMLDFRRDRTVTPDAVAIWVEGMLARMSLRSVANRTRDLWYAMRVLHPQRDWRWLWEDAEALCDEAGPVRSKLSRICDIRDIRRAAIARMRRAEAKPKTTAAALEFQDGFVMLLLSYRPVRRRNLAETRLGINFVFDQAFRSGRLLYESTKAGNRYEAVLPDKVLPWLRRFIEVYRPILAGPGVTDEAWLSREGGPLSAGQLQRRIRRATQQELGKPISLHLFRDCLATTVSEIAPERIEDAARILGHRQARDSGRKSRHHLPAIEFYRQVSATTLAGRKLAALQEPYRLHRRQGKTRVNGLVVKLSS
jgi:hypothetical protein